MRFLGEHQGAGAIGGSVTGGMAVCAARRISLSDCVQSIVTQVDRLQIYANGFSEAFKPLTDPRVTVVLSGTAFGDMGDAGKFHGAFSGNGVYLITG